MKSEYSPLIDIMEEKCRARAAGLDASFSFHPKETGTGAPAEDAAAVFCARGYTATIFFDTVTAGVYNVLECRIKLDCTDPYTDFSLYDLLYLLDENDFHTYIFPGIDTQGKMSACLDEIFRALFEYSERLAAIGENREICLRAQAGKRREIEALLRRDIFALGESEMIEWHLNCYREIYVGRMCLDWYADYVCGRYERAAYRLSRMSSKSGYEQRLLRFMRTLGSGVRYEVTPPACAAVFSRGNSRSHGKMRAYLLSTLVCAPIMLAFFSAVAFAVRTLLYRTCDFAPLDAPTLVGSLTFCTVVSSAFAARVVYPRFMKKEERESHTVLGGKAAEEMKIRTGRVLFRFLAVILLCLITLEAKSTVAFYPGYIVDNTGLVSKAYAYTDVDAVYKKGSSYTVKMKNGDTVSCRGMEEAVQNLLSKTDTELKVIN